MLFIAIKIAVIIAADVYFVIVKSALCRGKFMPQLAIGLLLYYKSHALFVQVCITEKYDRRVKLFSMSPFYTIFTTPPSQPSPLGQTTYDLYICTTKK